MKYLITIIVLGFFINQSLYCQQVNPNGITTVPGTTVISNMPSGYPTNDFSWVRSWDVQKPGMTNPYDVIHNGSVREVKQVTQYIDGLGRNLQTVAKGISPLGYDMVSPEYYDDFGRQTLKYLPYVQTGDGSGNFKTNPFYSQSIFMNAQPDFNGEQVYYGKSEFESSPLGRITKNMAPGNSWAGSNRGIETAYEFNTSNEVYLFTIDITQGSLPVSSAYYDPSVLYRTTEKDENGKRVVEYKDKSGKIILKKVEINSNANINAHAGWLCTYYVYDDLGLLRFVISPKATEYFLANGNINAVADELCFKYEYDQRNRMIIKKVPGAGEVWMVYDTRDRLALMQDANMRNTKWVYTKYDNLNRPIETGFLNNGADRATFQGYADTYTNATNPDFPYSWWSCEMLTQTYYDNYNWVSATGTSLSSTIDQTYTGNSNYFNTSYDTAPDFPVQISQAVNITGLATGTITKILGTNQFLYSVHFYDENYRVIQTQTINITGGKDVLTTQYTFGGKVLRTLLQHQKNGNNSQNHLVLTKMTYDDAGRPTAIIKNISSTINGNNINTSDKIISTLSYNESGQLQQKNLGYNQNTLSAIENLNYEYNIRGWLKSINKNFVNPPPPGIAYLNAGNFFGETLSYDYGFNTLNGQGGYFNGNIAGVQWKNAGNKDVQRAYGYNYDAANRLLKADYSQVGGTTANFNVIMGDDGLDPTTAYDANGNIKRMQQWGIKGVSSTSPIDDLHYRYDFNGGFTNKLSNVTDWANDPTTTLGDFRTSSNYAGKSATSFDYNYDVNGNMSQDNNKDINNIAYNYLNLPQNIQVINQTGIKGTITYTYDAAGVKLSKTTQETGATVNYNNNSYTTDVTTVTTYINGFIYQDKTYSNPNLTALNKTGLLQEFAHEEGRIRFEQATIATCPAQPDRLFFDYLVKDHLGNTRAVVTEQNEQTCYPWATLEDSRQGTEQQLYNIDNGRRVDKNSVGAGSYGSFESKVYQVHGGLSGQQTGLEMVLKVMPGDNVVIRAESFYNLSSGNANSIATMAVTSLLGAFTNSSLISTGAHSGVNTTQLSSSGNNYGVISNYINNIPYSYNQPKAAINWILFDEQLNYVTGSFDMVQYGGGYKLHTLNAPITKAGYLYIYASNESNLPVFFDNLGVTHTNGPVLELTDYYPFGLTMAGISSKTANSLENKKRYNGNELQNKEFNDGSGIEFYDFNARTYNQQVGRFLQIDPTPEDGEQESLTPYHFSGNNPATFNDPNGKCPWCWGAIIGAAVEYGTQVASNLAQGKSLGESLTDVKGGQILIAAVAGAASGGVSAFVPKGAVATVVKEAVVAGIGAAESAAKQYNATGKISGTKILTDVAANFVGDKLTKNIKVNSSSAIKTTEKQLDRATRIAANDATSSGRAATVKNLETKVSSMNATNKRVQATAAGAAGSTLQAGVDAAIENSTNSKPVAPPGYNINKPVVDNTAVKIIIPTHL